MLRVSCFLGGECAVALSMSLTVTAVSAMVPGFCL
jgi:hypothetical protein